jgi:RNA polymerase sigma-70 factor (ECF subfamily)
VALVDSYLVARAAITQGEAASPEELTVLEHVLVALYARARAAHPEIAVSEEEFCAHLGRCGAPLEKYVGGVDLHAEDLYLCCAGLRGDEAAVRRLRANCRSALTGYLRHIDTSPDFFDEVEQQLSESALIGSIGKPPRLITYSGRGSLASWMGVAAQRIAITMRRHDAAEKRAIDAARAEAHLIAADPELSFVKDTLREPFQRAVIAALTTLDDRQRMVYSLHVVDGLTVERIGRSYGVRHTTVSRWMASARAAIIAEASRILRDEMQLAPEEFESLARLLASQLDLSVSSVLVNVA